MSDAQQHVELCQRCGLPSETPLIPRLADRSRKTILRMCRPCVKAVLETDEETKKWILNPADQRAAENGCWMDEERGWHTVNWIEGTCVLYEGDKAGQPMELGDWQWDATMRLFGWVRYSEDFKRVVRRFKKASIWIAKKNAKSPQLASWGLYMLCGDGEEGQKCYSMARDGKQAMISHRHALEMIKRSPRLAPPNGECKINAVTAQITHKPTRSNWFVVAGDNPQSQEGLNGSLFVDECHVVTDKLMKVVKYAGISRSEPLHIEVSTAGNNPESYGKAQYDAGQRTERCEPGYEDDSLLFINYSAPQDLTFEELDRDPVKYGRMANPTWGRIIRESEFLESYEKAKRTLSDLLEFLMYRLNIWQRSSNPWLREADWLKCRLDYTEDDLKGRECWAGLDLSRTTDFSALVLCFQDFPRVEEYALLAYFWLPEAIAQQRDHLAPFRQWAASGYITLTPGNVIDYGFIKSHFRELAKRFNIKELAYDPKFAEEVTQSLEQGVVDMAGKVIEEGTGVPRFAFAQDDKNFAVPTLDFERLVIEGKLHHNNHPVLTWQIGHANAHVGWNKVKRVFKPTKGDVRTVDGVLSGIMSLGRCKIGDTENWYTPGSVFG